MTDLSIAREFQRYFRETCESVLVNENVDPKRVFYLRPSALPYCALKNFLIYAQEGIPETADSRAPKLYYTGVGTKTHEVFQKIIGRGGRILGNWRCPHCKNVEMFSTYHACKKCGSSMQSYEELEVKNGAWRGHLDNLYIAKNKELWIVDYKTCKKDFIFKKQYGASREYVEQQNNYVVMLEEKIKKPIAGWMLVYLARENPIQFHRIIPRRLNDEKKTNLREANHLMSRLHLHVWKVDKMSMVKPLYRYKRCSSEKEHNAIFRFNPCPFKNECFKHKEMIGKIREIVNNSKHLPLIQYMPKEIKTDLYDERRSNQSS